MAVLEGEDSGEMAFEKELLLGFMNGRLGLDITGIDEETPLFSSGVIDSAGMADLIAFIESASHVRFEPDDISLDNLDSIGRILDFIGGRCDQ
jgi:acyl carrier protein